MNEKLRRRGETSARSEGSASIPVPRWSVRVPVRNGSVVFGESVNIAFRIQAGAAAPGSIFISDSTLSLLKGRFVTRHEGSPSLKGISRPIKLYRIVSASSEGDKTKNWNEPRALVGRFFEKAALHAEWERALKGKRRVVVLSGEPGIGKSRLLRSLRSSVSRDSYTWLEAHCAPLTQGTTLSPVISLIKRTLGISDESPEEQKLPKLERGLETNAMGLDETVPPLAALLGLQLAGSYEGHV